MVAVRPERLRGMLDPGKRRAGARIQGNELMALTQTTGSEEIFGSHRLRILLVDDHPAVRLGTRSLIHHAYPHSEVIEAGDAAEAIEQSGKQEFDLVFLDLRLPEHAGAIENLEVGKRTLHRIREMDGPPVGVMSGEGRDRALVEEMMALGAATFVPKSASVGVSLEAIRRALADGVRLPPEMIGKGGDSPPLSAEALRAPLPEPITHAVAPPPGRAPLWDCLQSAAVGGRIDPQTLSVEINAR
jgi:DNA-binding NarL/FixJ family response regulator